MPEQENVRKEFWNEAKLITIGYVAILVITGLAWKFTHLDLRYSLVYVFIPLSLMEMVIFHIRWIDKDIREENEDFSRKKSLLRAIGIEALNLVSGVIGFLVLLIVLVSLQELTGISAAWFLMGVVILMGIGFLVYPVILWRRNNA